MPQRTRRCATGKVKTEMKRAFFFRSAALLLMLALLLCGCAPGVTALSSAEELLTGSSEELSSEPEPSSEPESSDGSIEEQSSEPEPPKPINRIAGNEAEIDAQVDKLFAGYSVVGGSVAAFEKGEVVYLHHFGTANRERGLPVSDATRFRVASISKAVTALFALMLQDEGKFTIDDDICLLVNEKLRSPAWPNKPITTRHLLTHTSGLVDGASYNEAISSIPFASLDWILTDGRIRTAAEPGTRFIYTNFGMGLTAGVIESVTGERFYDYTGKIFDEWGMDAAYVVEQLDDRSQVATMYRSGEPTAEPSKWRDMAKDYVNVPVGQMYLLGQGELYISAYDLARIGGILAGDGELEGKRVISRELLDEMHTVQFIDEESGSVRGLGVERFDKLIEGKSFWGHQGNAYGMLSGLIYDRDNDCGFVILTNSCVGGKKDGVYGINRAVVKELWQYFETEETQETEE